MSCSVNLVPHAQFERRTLHRRRRTWLATGAALSLLIGVGAVLRAVAAQSLAQRVTRVAALDAQATEVQRRLTLAAADRAKLLARLEAAGDARRPQPWPQRLSALTAVTPATVCLSSIQILTPASHEAPDKPAAGKAPTTNRSVPASPAPGVQLVRVTGIAQDHVALAQAVEGIKRLPGWEKVDLVRATAEPYRSGVAVAFELACETREDRY
jgi:Tfp pilus assembly protein PilN